MEIGIGRATACCALVLVQPAAGPHLLGYAWRGAAVTEEELHEKVLVLRPRGRGGCSALNSSDHVCTIRVTTCSGDFPTGGVACILNSF